MDDKELITALRSQIGDDVQHVYDHEALFRISADRIEALAKERDALAERLEREIADCDAADRRAARFADHAERLEADLEYANKRIEHAFERIERQAQTIDDLVLSKSRVELELDDWKRIATMFAIEPDVEQKDWRSTSLKTEDGYNG